MHILCTGVTLCGKSWALKQVAGLLREDMPIGVCDPMGVAGVDDWPGVDLVCHDRRAFLRAFWGSSRTLWIIDEAADILQGEADRAVLTKGRHLGHTVIIVAQRAVMLRPSLRTQCAAVLTGIQDVSDAEDLARQFVAPELRTVAPGLPRGSLAFVESASGGRIDLGSVLKPGGPFVRRVADAIRRNHPEPSPAFLAAAQPRPGRPDWGYLIAGGHIAAEDVYQ